MILESVFFIFSLPFLILKEWILFLFHILKSSITGFWKWSFIEKLLFLSTFAQLFFALRPWIYYTVNFVEVEEVIFVSSKINLYLVISCLITFFLGNFGQFQIHKKLFISFELILAIVYITALVYPNPILTDFRIASDFNYTFAVYGYGGSIFLALLTSILEIRRKEQSLEVQNLDDLNVSTSYTLSEPPEG
ncbi:MAG: hypothetical protein H7A24_07760 [Leptospiraceae bacterium]|nr:hypothetical protein [Leptospiraceae bacterium]